jgi:hypothetical protein
MPIALETGDFALLALAFTLAPHLQPINHRGCFSCLAGI